MPVVISLIIIIPSLLFILSIIFLINFWDGNLTNPEELPGSNKKIPICSKGILLNSGHSPIQSPLFLLQEH